MAAFESTPLVGRGQGLHAAAALVRRPRHPDIPILVAGCWAILVVAELTGVSAALHHHALIEGGAPLTAAVPMFLVGWLVMAAAMMLPASLRAIQLLEAGASSVISPRRARSAFLASFALVWTAFGLVAFWATSASTTSSTRRRGSRSGPGSSRRGSWRSRAVTSSSRSSGVASLLAVTRLNLPSRPPRGASADSISATASPALATRGP
jgi:hypothetical protein